MRVSLVCQIKTDQNTHYKIQVGDPELLVGGEKTKPMNSNWILKSGWTGYVNPGTLTYAPVLYLKVPSDTAKSTVSVQVKVINLDDSSDTGSTHDMVFDLIPVNFFQTTLC